MKLTFEQKQLLLANQIVLKITKHHVVFTPEFKAKAAELSVSGHPPNDIFISHGIDVSFFKEDYCANLLKKWRKKLQDYGKASFFEESRGRKTSADPKDDLDDMDIDDLKAIIRIQRGMFEEVKKLKALVKKR